MRTAMVTAMVMAALACWAVADAQDCLDYRAYPHLVGNLPTPGIAVSVAVAGDHAYMGDYFGGNHFHVVGIADPTGPVLLGSVDLPIRLNAVEASGGRVYGVGDSYLPAIYTLYVFDVDDPTQPAILGQLDLPDRGFGMDVQGDLAYIACDGAGLQIVDISDPAELQVVGTLATESTAFGARVDGDILYLATYTGGLLIVDVADPGQPQVLATVSTSGHTYQSVLAGDLLFVADGSAGLKIVDVGSPASPVVVGQWIGPHSVQEVDLSPGRAHVVDLEGTFHTLDISDPTQPFRVYSVDIGPFSYAQEVEVSGGHAFIAARNAGLQVVALANGLLPPQIGSLETGSLTDLCAGDGPAFALQGDDLLAIDLSDPVQPQILGQITIPTTAPAACAVSGDLVLVARLEDSGYAGPVVPGGLEIVDASDTQHMQIIGGVQVGLDVRDVQVSGNFAYLACNDSAPMSPVGRLVVVDISDPVAPYICGEQWFEQATAVTLCGATAVVTAEGWPMAHLVNVMDPSYPQLTQTLTLETPVSRATARGTQVFLVGQGLAILQILAPGWGVVVGETPLYLQGMDIAVAGDVAYLAGDNSVRLFDVSDPLEPREIGARFQTGMLRAVDANSGAILCGTTFGLECLHLQCDPQISGLSEPEGAPPAVPALRAMAHPNPFNPATTLSFHLPAAGPVRVEVYDVRGHRVVELVDRFLPEGEHAVVWRGKDEMGREAPTGSYFFRVEAAGRVATVKAVLLK